MSKIDPIIVRRVLNNRGTRREAEMVAEWLSSPEGQAWLSEAIDTDAGLIDKNIMPITGDIPVDEILERIMARIRRKQIRRIALSCAAVLVPCIIMLTVWFNLNNRIGGALFADAGMESIHTGRGEQKEIVFQDGTSVILNGESTLTYPHRFGISKRNVTLKGEAFFKVEPNKRRSFIVQIGDDMSVKVLGTSFNINSYEENPTIDVTLITGLVEFRNDDDIYNMNPDECLSYNKTTGEVKITHLKNSNMNALWTENVLVFQDSPIESVLLTLSRKFDVDFEIMDAGVKACSYTMKTPKGTNLPEIISDLEQISPVRFVFKDGKYRIYSTAK
ncbi:MAG: FecR family protein [Candidatus Cryptobacteroides sp.]